VSISAINWKIKLILHANTSTIKKLIKLKVWNTILIKSLSEPLMKIMHKLLIRENSTIEEFPAQELWNHFETDETYF
jgi:hypothetical protein